MTHNKPFIARYYSESMRRWVWGLWWYKSNRHNSPDLLSIYSPAGLCQFLDEQLKRRTAL